MKLLYIQPWNFSDLSQRERFQKGHLSSLGIPRAMFEVLYYLQSNIQVDILDTNLELLENPRIGIQRVISKKLLTNNYDVVFLNFPAVALGNVVGQTILTVKERQSDCKVVVGGSAAELMQEDILRFWPADYCYVGDGAEIPQIVECLKNPQAFPKIAGLYRKVGNKVKCPEISDGKRQLMDNYSPDEFYTLNGRFNFQQYLARHRRLGLELSACLEMTRGCSYSCTFCAINKSGGVRFRNPATVAREAEFLLKNSVNKFYLIDPTLGLNWPLTEKLLYCLTELKKEFPQMELLGITRCDRITDELAKKLKGAGFSTITLGVETMSNDCLKEINKKIVSAQSKKAVEILWKNGIMPRLALIHFPDTFSKETVDFLVGLSKKKMDFLVQSSFYRPLYQKGIYKNPSDFRRWDQRTDNRPMGLDSNLSLLEWLICNLGFPSTDINCQKGDWKIGNCLENFTLPADLKFSKNTNLAITVGNKYYLYQPREPFQIIKSALWTGDEINYLDQVLDLATVCLDGRR